MIRIGDASHMGTVEIALSAGLRVSTACPDGFGHVPMYYGPGADNDCANCGVKLHRVWTKGPIMEGVAYVSTHPVVIDEEPW